MSSEDGTSLLSLAHVGATTRIAQVWRPVLLNNGRGD